MSLSSVVEDGRARREWGTKRGDGERQRRESGKEREEIRERCESQSSQILLVRAKLRL